MNLLERVVRRPIAIGEAQEVVEVFAMVADPVAHSRRVGTLRIHPGARFAVAVLAVEDALLEASKAYGVARAAHRETKYRQAIDDTQAARVVVAPRHVVARASGEHGHVVAGSEVLRDQPRMEFGAAGDLRTVALDDDGQLHDLPRGVQRVEACPESVHLGAQCGVLLHEIVQRRSDTDIHLELLVERQIGVDE